MLFQSAEPEVKVAEALSRFHSFIDLRLTRLTSFDIV